ncbi:hypothetical protein C1H46_016730 [Malus baccata]|uniref:Uncharacterized protein n=1 Tax=Malus baccata TaxID=106549 RepID=A0A540MG03_MALBA|nr:hypothetical protein C1H46_016730 [Malus baccata]
MATVIIQSIMKNTTHVLTAEKVEALFELIKGLIEDLDGPLNDEVDKEDGTWNGKNKRKERS